MFCPNCGQQRISTDTSFCSRCGFLLTGTAELLETGGMIPRTVDTGDRSLSPRNRGLKKGLFVFLLTFLVVPLVALITVAIRAPPFGIAITAILLFVGGLLRMAYALMFESAAPDGGSLESSGIAGPRPLVNRGGTHRALPPQETFPVEAYVSPAAGNWRDTNELEPRTVTEGTTKLLEEEDLPQ